MGGLKYCIYEILVMIVFWPNANTCSGTIREWFGGSPVWLFDLGHKFHETGPLELSLSLLCFRKLLASGYRCLTLCVCLWRIVLVISWYDSRLVRSLAVLSLELKKHGVTKSQLHTHHIDV